MMELEVKNTGIPTHIVNLWQRVVDIIAVSLSVPSAMINRLEPPDLEVFRSNIDPKNPFPSGSRIPLAGIYCEAAAKRREKIKITDARKDPEWADSPTAKAGIYAYLGYPIFWPDGEVFGTFCVIDTKENNWGATTENLLLTFKEAIEEHLALVCTYKQLEKKNEELERALSKVKILKGLLPICSYCKNIRDDEGDWTAIESYISDRTDAKFSHSVCPTCSKKIYPGLKIITK
jgi:GAF domain-containing protein